STSSRSGAGSRTLCGEPDQRPGAASAATGALAWLFGAAPGARAAWRFRQATADLRMHSSLKMQPRKNAAGRSRFGQELQPGTTEMESRSDDRLTGILERLRRPKR